MTRERILNVRLAAAEAIKTSLACGLMTVGVVAHAPVQAADGCLVLLCLAAPSWRAVEQCVPPIQQLFRDLARGKPFPSCSMSRDGNTATHEWSNAPAFCPPQYTRSVDVDSGLVYRCDYTGAISVSIDGVPFTRTWWNLEGGSVTEFGPAAKAQLGSWDTRFDDDYRVWLEMQPPAAANLP